MRLLTIKQNIAISIDDISSYDLLILTPNNPNSEKWGSMEDDEVQAYLKNIINLLVQIKKNISILDNLSSNELTNLYEILQRIILNYNEFKEIELKDITSNHHSVLNEFEKLNIHLKSIGLYPLLEIKPDINNIKNNLRDANKLLKDFDSERFGKAITLVNELTERKVNLEGMIINESLGTFLDRANEHKYLFKKFQVTWLWLVLAIGLGVVIIWMVYGFQNAIESDNTISVGESILRVSSLAVPTYFLYFCINQYNNHRSMYEAYSYRNTALKLMNELRTTNTDKSDLILERGLKVLFSEPSAKDNVKYDKQIINDLVSILSSQVGKKE